MSLLAMTPPMVAAVKKYKQAGGSLDSLQKGSDPSLADAKIGSPISYGQVIDLSNALASKRLIWDDENAFDLSNLLSGSSIYEARPEEENENSSEYDRLMARLRREEENRTYNQMVGSKKPFETHLPSAAPIPNDRTASAEDEISYADVNRQMTLIINVLISIVTCGVAIWLASYHWSTPTRLALSMSGSLVVAVAEVTIYGGYLRRLGEAKSQEKAKRERKVITETWVIEKSDRKDPVPVTDAKEKKADAGIRLRNKTDKT